MRSSHRLLVRTLALGGIALVAGCATDTSIHEAKAAPAPSAAEMVARWQAFMTPGPEHKVLDALVGKWTTHVKWWMDPKTPPQESEGTAEMDWILGGRYLHESDSGMAMGAPLEGMGVTGYDNLKEKYVAGWIDNMGTGIMSAEGTYNPAKKTLTFATSGPDATLTKYVPMHIVGTFVDANTYTWEMYAPDASGKEFRAMEIVYKRAK